MTAASGWRRSLAEQLFENLELAGLVRRDGEVWQTTGSVPRAKAAVLAEDLLREYPQHSLDVGLLERCGPRLGEVLSGKIDGTEVLFSDDGFQFLERFYRESSAQAFYNSVVSDVITACGGENLRVLEVGGGTAGTTSHLLPKLGSTCESYVFTDVSPLFLERARAKFSTYENFSTKLFDLTKDPTAQGIEPASFDLIVAANVLHATKDVEVSTNRLRHLLAPGGVLVLLEITRHPRWLDIVFGLTEGWWKFEDCQRRPSYPLMSGATWVGLMGECGMEQAAVVADRPSGEPAQSVVIARRPLSDPQRVEQQWLLLADQRGVARRLAEVLKARGCHCNLLPAATADLTALGSDSSRLANLHGVLYLGSIDSPKLDESKLLEQASFEVSSASGCNGALAALQCLFQGTPLAERKMVLVTAGAFALGGDVAELLQAPLWGVGRVVCKEWPNLQCQMVDLSAAATDEELAALADEILREDAPAAAREEELAFRGSQRFVHRLRRTTLAAVADAEPPVVAGPDDAWRAEIVTARSLEHIGRSSCTPR